MPLSPEIRIAAGVDAALAIPVHQHYVNRLYPRVDTILTGIIDMDLGDKVLKVGRTTELTHGTVEGVNSMVKVRYDGGTATFDNQLEIRSSEGKEFSAGGDSGSAILTDDGLKMGGLLFAGSPGPTGVTIANRISDVVDLLGVKA